MNSFLGLLNIILNILLYFFNIILDILFNSFQIASKSILREKFRRQPPDVYIEVEVEGIAVLDFHKVDEILEQSASAQAQLEAALTELAL